MCASEGGEGFQGFIFFLLENRAGAAWCRGKRGAQQRGSGRGARRGALETLLSPVSPRALPATSVLTVTAAAVPAAGSAKHKPFEMLPTWSAPPAPPGRRDGSAPMHASCCSHPGFPPPLLTDPLGFLQGIRFGFWVSVTFPHSFLGSRSPSSLLFLGPGQHQQCKGGQGESALQVCLSGGDCRVSKDI